MRSSLTYLALVIGSITSVAVANPVGARSHVVHEKRHTSLRSWKKRDRVHKDLLLPVRIGLTQNNLEKGYSFLMDVSHPASPNYGKHWTADQVHEAFAPSQETVTEVRAWLNASGISDERVVHSENKGWLAFNARAHEIEGLLRTQYHEYHHANGEVRVGATEYHVPVQIQRHIDYITPGVKLSSPTKKSIKKRASPSQRSTKKAATLPVKKIAINETGQPLANCGTQITPLCLKALYQLPDLTSATPGNSLGIFEDSTFDVDVYSQEDLDMFFSKYAPNIPQGTSPLPAFFNGATAPVPQSKSGGESVMDITVAFSLIYPQNITLYQSGLVDHDLFDNGTDNGTVSGTSGLLEYLDPFMDALDGSYCANAGGAPLQCGVYKPTNVISISYGLPETGELPRTQERTCNEYMKLGLQGVSIVVASGDYGVAAESELGCIGEDKKIFGPESPSCPYITSVGSTELKDGQSISDPESATSRFGSAGGFSNIFARPQYQDTAVNHWMNNTAPYLPFTSYDGGDHIGANGGVFNRAGRGYPDVSAIGENFMMYLHGKLGPAGGTSLSAPIWASVLTLVNEARISAGKGPVGFVNPVLYQHPEVFNDITNGSNPGCSSEGFKAVKGWDPVTGLGTPNYPSLEKLFLSLP